MVDALRRRGRIGAHEAAMEEEHDPFAAQLTRTYRKRLKSFALLEAQLNNCLLMWNIGVAAVFVLLSGRYGYRLLGWMAPLGSTQSRCFTRSPRTVCAWSASA